MRKKPVVLMILDGYGLNERKDHNAVAEANTPVMDSLMKDCPFVKGNASGMAVGLPEGQMGNSEVGHLNMGAGRIVYQELTRITKEIQDGTFFENPARRDDRCPSCRWYPLCRGGCKRDCEEQAGTVRNYYCEVYIEFFEYAIGRLEWLAENRYV